MSNNPYAPILHTGYANTYSEETVEKFTDWCAKQGFSGFSMEGKSKAPTDEIDQWIETYLTSTAYGVKHAAEHGWMPGSLTNGAIPPARPRARR